MKNINNGFCQDYHTLLIVNLFPLNKEILYSPGENIEKSKNLINEYTIGVWRLKKLKNQL